MKPIDFPEANALFAKNQPPYLPLPGYSDPKDRTGLVITCWRGSWRERWLFLLTGRLYLRVLTFKQLLQPQRPQVNSPFPNPDAHWTDPFWQMLVDWKAARKANEKEIAKD
jgi:hypothetical protein